MILLAPCNKLMSCSIAMILSDPILSLAQAKIVNGHIYLGTPSLPNENLKFLKTVLKSAVGSERVKNLVGEL